jgi:hypothetical protein
LRELFCLFVFIRKVMGQDQDLCWLSRIDPWIWQHLFCMNSRIKLWRMICCLLTTERNSRMSFFVSFSMSLLLKEYFLEFLGTNFNRR